MKQNLYISGFFTPYATDNYSKSRDNLHSVVDEHLVHYLLYLVEIWSVIRVLYPALFHELPYLLQTSYQSCNRWSKWREFTFFHSPNYVCCNRKYFLNFERQTTNVAALRHFFYRVKLRHKKVPGLILAWPSAPYKILLGDITLWQTDKIKPTSFFDFWQNANLSITFAVNAIMRC